MDTSSIEAQIAEIVQADNAARQRTPAAQAQGRHELVHIAKLILGSREIIIGALIALAMVLAAPAIEMLK